MFSSVTGPVVNLATHVIGSLGLAGVAFMTAASGIIGLPGTEATMLFAGFNVSQHKLTLLGVIVFGIIGDLVAASIAYGIGHWGRRELFEQHGSKVHLSADRLGRANRWTDRYGPAAVFVSRLIPGVRFVFPYAAGVAEMSFVRFISFAAAGSVVWMTGLGFLGRQVGSNWKSWRNHLEYVDYAFVALVIALIVWVVVRRVRSSRRAVDAVPD